MNGENVDTRKSNCSAMTKPKDKISDIRNSTATLDENLTSQSTREYSREGYSAKYWSVTCMLPEFRGKIKYSTQESRRKYKTQIWTKEEDPRSTC